MHRRAVLLITLLVAVACTDQPTEPTKTESRFQADLGPAPADVTTLSAGVPAAGGGPIRVDLGVWESPALAKITVSGSLSWSGPDSGVGFYPNNSGEFDDQGMWIPSQGNCASQLSVRIDGFGPVGGAFGYCPATWLTGGTPPRYAIVSGSIYAVRTSPAPGACFYGGTKCATITGDEQVSVDPVEANLTIKLDTTVARPGQVVGAQFGVDPAVAGEGQSVPWSLREIRFEGQGPIVGGGTPKGCETWFSSTKCGVRVFQSGYVVAEGIANGRLKTERQWIRVIGGDSLPPQPPDSTPSDTTHGGGGGGGGGCAPAMRPSIRLAACQQTTPDSIKILWFAVPSRGADSSSFTTRAGERTIQVHARVWPESFADQIQWTVSDFPNDSFVTALPQSMIQDHGSVLEFDVPDQDTLRFNHYGTAEYDEHDNPTPNGRPGYWYEKTLGYRVVAYIPAADAGNGTTARVESKPFDVVQDELDVQREEYIELLASRGKVVPRREDFSFWTISYPGENSGDYRYRMYRAGFQNGVDSLQTLFLALKPRTWQVNVVYRGVVHNLRHVPSKQGPSRNSWHMYGCAADLQTFPVHPGPDTSTVAYHHARAYWDDLSSLADSLQFGIEPLKESGIGHVHVHRFCYP